MAQLPSPVNKNDGKLLAAWCDDYHVPQLLRGLGEQGLKDTKSFLQMQNQDIVKLAQAMKLNVADAKLLKKSVEKYRNDQLSANDEEKQEENVKKWRFIPRQDTPIDLPKTHRSVLLVGEERVETSAVINWMANYLFGVKYQDQFRYKLTQEEESKDGDSEMNAKSMKMVSYYVKPPHLELTLTLTDMAGYAGMMEEDRKDREMMMRTVEHAMRHVNIVCFVVKGNLSYLSVVQCFLLTRVLRMAEQNDHISVFFMITHADNQEPPVMRALEWFMNCCNSRIKFDRARCFKLDNSRILDIAEYSPSENESNKACFDMGMQNMRTFFDMVRKEMTKWHLERVKTLYQDIKVLATEIGNKLHLAKLAAAYDGTGKAANDILVKEVEVEKTATKNHANICIYCDWVCHPECGIAENGEKNTCNAINTDTGHCKICVGKCHWKAHYTFDYLLVRVAKTSRKMSEIVDKDPLVKFDLVWNMKKLHGMIKDMDGCIEAVNQLNEIPFKGRPDYLKSLIAAEKLGKQPGHEDRLAVYEALEKQREILVKLGDHKGWAHFDWMEAFKVHDRKVLLQIRQDQEKSQQSSGWSLGSVLSYFKPW